MTKDIEREAFEKALAGNNIHNLKVCTIFDDEKNEYFASDVCDPSEDHIVESINLSWRMWQAAKAHEAKKLEVCVVVPKDQIEVWWQDSEEPENFATKEDDLSFIAQHIQDDEIMEINEHHTIHLPSITKFGAWVYQSGQRTFFVGNKDEVEAARGGNE
ncbi:hypothetical protein [Acinetobacter junii]|uniref:hypothetical protein n=1 Tax=Acinetobacter junii TaxID=40215 RepID=UPI0021CDD32B|nr:hypothetical protein [Acinetobacter junii]MCU4408412.1 hypothetical protein [Acinetobacter junii]MDU6056332.1 hypothetical protein [Acinetobacter junii]